MTRLLFAVANTLLVVLLTGCSASQQDALLDASIDFARSSQALELKYSQALDVNMAYLERAGSGPTLLLVHGFSANKDTWLRFTRYLPDNYRLIIPDLAGHGDTDVADSHDLLMQMQRLHALADQLDIKAWHIAGNSMGGAIAALYAAHHPEHVLSLALLDAAGVDGRQQSPFFAALEQGYNPLIASDEASFERRWQLVMSQPPPLPWPLRPAVIRRTLKRQALNRQIFADMLATKETLAQQHFEQQLKQRAHMPVLIMWGQEDQVLDVSSVEAYQQLLPQADVVIYPGIGHLPMIETAEQSAEDYLAFLQKHFAVIAAK